MDDSSVTFKYKFDSGTGPWEEGRYVREINMDIFSQDEDGNALILIGKVGFKIVYVDQAMETGYDLYEIFDSHEYTFRHAQDFFDFDTEQVKEDIQRFYDYDIMQLNICLLERIEILPAYRGNKIAAKAIKDITFHFGSGCGLFIIQAYPLQFESKDREHNDWQKQLGLNSFPTQGKTAFKQLRDYYKSIGFDEIPGYEDLLFYNPHFKNTRLDSINLDE